MSRFTEHFDMDTTQFMYSQAPLSPSKSSFMSMSSSDSSPNSPRTLMDPVLTQSFSSFESNSSTPSSCSDEEDKPFSTKLKRFLTTISKKKKRSMSSHSQ